jgi:signal transduction histidine kinase
VKLTTKLVLILLAGALLLLTADGYFSVRREIALFEHDMERDAQLVGRVMQGILGDLWDSDQRGRALDFIDEVNSHAQSVRVHWVPSDSLPESPRTAGPSMSGSAGADGDTIRSVWLHGADSALHTYVSIRGRSGDLLGALEIVESRDDLSRYVRTTVVRRLVLAVVLLLVSAAAIVVLGVTIVGRPLQKLIDGTRRIGAGDLTAHVRLSGHDELDELAAATNTTVEQLRTSREELEAETARRIAALEELRHADRLRTVGRLASGIAHELGTPLNVVSGRASMVEEGGLSPEKTVEIARIIRTQADRMTQIVRQLLDFARRPRAHRAPVELRECADGVRGLLEPLARKKGISLVLGSAEGSARAIGDRSQIEQVITNLVINAVHASPDGGQIELAVGSQPARPPAGHNGSAGPHAFIRVSDRGMGIPEHSIDNLFEPFFTTKDVGEGTGLGLSVAYSIAQEHDGWIAVRNRDGGGAEFTVYLPEASEHDR